MRVWVFERDGKGPTDLTALPVPFGSRAPEQQQK